MKYWSWWYWNRRLLYNGELWRDWWNVNLNNIRNITFRFNLSRYISFKILRICIATQVYILCVVSVVLERLNLISNVGGLVKRFLFKIPEWNCSFPITPLLTQRLKFVKRLGCFGVTAMLSWSWLKWRLIEVEVDWSWGWLKLRLIEVEVDWSSGWLKLMLI